MNNLTTEFDKINEFLNFKDYSSAIKRMIDFTLDAENTEFYRTTNQFLDWYDTNHNSDLLDVKIREVFQHLFDFLAVKEQNTSDLLINLEEVVKSYSGDFSLGAINLQIFSGQIVGLVGENGNGKTTLLRTLCGELCPTSGKVDYNFKYSDEYDLRTKLVYIPQRTKTWYGSMYQNLEFAASCYGYSEEDNNLVVNLVIARLGLREYRNHSWKNLSSGYKMRFELARMLLRKPKILLIDEPLANLDILAQQTVLEDFRQIANSPFRPLAIVLSSQQLYEVEKVSDEVVFLKNGKQQNLNEINSSEKYFTIELETDETISSLKEKLNTFQLKEISQNGVTIIVSFESEMTMEKFMKILIEKSIAVNYLRNITHSSRRFFVK